MKGGGVYRSIGIAAQELDVPVHELHFWEKKFPRVTASRSRSGQRRYSEREFALLAGIHDLLYRQGYAHHGVQRQLTVQGIEYVRQLGFAAIKKKAQQLARSIAEKTIEQRSAA